MKNSYSNNRDKPRSQSHSAYLKNNVHYNSQNSNYHPLFQSNSKQKVYLSNNISKNQESFEPKEIKISLQRKRTASQSQDRFKIEYAVKDLPKKKEVSKAKSSYSEKILKNHNFRYEGNYHKKKTKKNVQQQLFTSNTSKDKNAKRASQHRRHKSSIKMNAIEVSSNKNLQKKNRSFSSLQRPNDFSRNASVITNKQKSIIKQEKKIEDISIKINYSYRTRQGALFSNPNKPNQDNYIIHENLAIRKEKQIRLFAVADGHGIHGHHVSKLIVDNLPKLINQQIKDQKKFLPKILVKVYDNLQNILSMNAQQINVMCSGSTLVTVILEGSTLICANTGDSRAILARQIDRKCWEMIYLSQDHKPSLDRQKKRIHKHGGRIHSFKNQKGTPIGPLRVWLPNQNIQGLAMSRSLGDNISKQVGVTHEPELIKIKLENKDKFILLASDGVWQFITNQEVLQLIVPFYRQNKLEEACDALLKLAYERWTTQDTSVVDDITFILIFINK